MNKLDKTHQVAELPNNIRVLTIQMPGSKVMYYEFQILAGMFYETLEETESAHFLEHLNGQFTSQKYPDARKNSLLIEQLGIERNAYVTDYIASYHLYGQKKHAPKMFDLISNTYLNFVIDRAVFKQEQNSIIEELENDIIDPWSAITEKTQQVLFPGHPASRPRKLSIENVKRLTPKDLLKFRERLYLPARTLLIVAGDMSHTAMMRQIKSAFTRVDEPTQETSLVLSPSFTWPPKDPKVTFVKNTNLNGKDSVQLVLTWRLPITNQNPDRFALSLLCHYLSNGLGSHLMIRLRTELGLIYSLDCTLELDPQNDQMSYLIISTNTQGKHLTTVRKTILQEIERLQKAPVSAKEFQAVSNEIQMELLDQSFNQAPEKYATQYSHNLLFKPQTSSVLSENRARFQSQTVQTFRDIYESYLRVTAKDLQRVTQLYLDSKTVITIYSAKKTYKDFTI